MVVYYPFIGALASAGGTIMERFILRKKQTNVRLHHCLEFLAITIVMLPFLYFFWQVSPEALETKNLVIMGLVIFFAMVANLFVFYSIKGDKVSNLEPARIMEPLFVVLLALFISSFFNSELYKSNPRVIYSALIAGVALIFSHIKKDHLSFNKYFIAATIGSFFFALELITSRLILDYYPNGFSFYFIRCASLFFLGIIILKPKNKRLNNSIYWGMLGLGAIWVLYRIIMYYGYVHLGIVSTTLAFMLSPIFIYLFAWIFLKEKPNWRNIIASIIIILCVLYGDTEILTAMKDFLIGFFN
jgi:drug/metabolite transporter (DMT)-like permease